MSWPVDGGGIGRPTMSSTGSLSNPQVNDVWTIVTPVGVEASDYSMMQDRGAGPITLTLTGPSHTVVLADIAPANTFWPVTVRDLSINLVSLPINTGAGPQVPGAPTIGTATAGNGTVTGPYSAPASNGGSAITKYTAYLFDVGGNVVQTIDSAPNPVVFSGVPNGAAYRVRVLANNAIGAGPLSGFSNAVTPSQVSLLPIDSKWVSEGDSIMAGSGTTSSSLALAADLITLGRMRMPLNFNQAVSGENSGQINSAPEIAAVNALLPKIVWLHVGTNDIGLTSNTPTQIRDNILAATNAYLAAGAAYVVIDQILPRNDTVWQGLSGARQADLAATNALIAALASSTIKILSVPPSFGVATHCLADQLHLNDAGVALMASAFQDIIATLVDQSADIRPLYLDSSNLLLAAGNPQLTGTTGTLSGGITGQVATGWSAAGAMDGTMAIVASKNASFNGAEAQVFTVSGTPATAARNFSFSRAITFSGQIGDQYEGWVDFQLTAGHTGVRNPGLIVSISGETSGESPGRTNAVLRTSGATASGVIRTYVSGVLTAARTAITLNFVCTFDAVALNAVLTIGRPLIRKVV